MLIASLNYSLQLHWDLSRQSGACQQGCCWHCHCLGQWEHYLVTLFAGKKSWELSDFSSFWECNVLRRPGQTMPGHGPDIPDHEIYKYMTKTTNIKQWKTLQSRTSTLCQTLQQDNWSCQVPILPLRRMSLETKKIQHTLQCTKSSRVAVTGCCHGCGIWF